MKNFKNLLFVMLGMLSIGFMTTSCNDKFSEEDLLKLQVQLGNTQDSLQAVKSLEALNQAGELVSFTVMVVSNDNKPAAGVDVTLTAGTAAGAADVQTLTTDATGKVFFERVAIGGNILSLSGAGFYDATMLVDFGQIQEGKHYQIVNGNIVPMPVTESAIIPLLGDATGTETATVTGNVKIETDVTNTAAEVPQNLTIYADFSTWFDIESSLNISEYRFDGSAGVGSAVVDNATGNYSMVVPSTPDGMSFGLIIPDIYTTQHIAINSIDGETLARPEYRDITTAFGPSFGTDWNTPQVDGAIVVFPAPPAAGLGFGFTFTRMGNPLHNISQGSGWPYWDNITVPLRNGNAVTQFTNLGSGYQFSPTVTITDAGAGADATAETWIEYYVNTITVTAAGTGYAANTGFNLDINYLDNQTVPVSQLHLNLFVTSSATGEITQTEVDAAIATAVANGDWGFVNTNYAEIYEVSTGMEIVFPAGGTAGTATVNINGRLSTLVRTNSGDGYERPAFAFSGGGGTTQAVMEVQQYGTEWAVDVDNSGITTPYPLLPSWIDLEYLSISTGTRWANTDNGVRGILNGNWYSFTGTPALKADGNGDLQWRDQTVSYKTDFFSDEQPKVIVSPNTNQIARADIGFWDIDATTGEITDVNINDNGNGYTAEFGATIEPSAIGAPGSGAAIKLYDFAIRTTGEYDWGWTWDFTNTGSGYLRDLNQENDRGYSGSSWVSNLMSGETAVINIDYGTGVRQENIN